MADSKYDGMFLDVLSNCGRVEPFLDAVFGFLYRRTDFYKIITSTDATMGFPPGYANKVAFHAFDKYEKLMKQATVEREKQKAQEKPVEIIEEDAPEAATEETITELGGEKVVTVIGDDQVVMTVDGNRSSTSSSDCYNGAERDNYSWTQSHTDIDVRVPISKTMKKSNVQFTARSLKVTALEDGKTVTLMEGDLSHRVKTSETVWAVVPGEHVHISLEKIEEKWWDSLIVGEEKISLNQLEVTKPFEQLDEESQRKIRELQEESVARLSGKVPVKKENLDEILKKAWDSDGSPFKGQPYDPSVIDRSAQTP